MTETIDITVETRGEQEPLDNPQRGCGHLKRGKCYLRGGGAGPGFSSEKGILPSWVEVDPPIPYREIGTDGSFTRGYQEFDGLSMQLALSPTERVPQYDEGERRHEFIPHSPGGNYQTFAPRNMIDAGLYSGPSQIPTTEVMRHVDRLQARGPEDGSHWGDIPVCGQTDLLMRCGETYYDTAEDYQEEAIQHGVSKAIPVGPGREPPQVVPGITRLWIMHPSAGPDDFGGALIGYCYLFESVFTEPEDGELPEYVEEMEEQGKLNVADIKPPEDDDEDDEDEAQADLASADWADDETGDESDEDAASDAQSVVPDERDHRDVRAADDDDSADSDADAETGGDE